LEIYSKGASESIVKKCLPETVPLNLSIILKEYSKSGYRILALAYKEIKESKNKKYIYINYIKKNFFWKDFPLDEVLKCEREEIENGLIFLGLLFFENPVKKNSFSVIQELLNVNLKAVMITGDNILTAMDISRQVGIIEETKNLGIITFDENTLSIEVELLREENLKARIRFNSIFDSKLSDQINFDKIVSQ
jgi:cation-transporting P-type ATPase 13A2